VLVVPIVFIMCAMSVREFVAMSSLPDHISVRDDQLQLLMEDVWRRLRIMLRSEECIHNVEGTEEPFGGRLIVLCRDCSVV